LAALRIAAGVLNSASKPYSFGDDSSVADGIDDGTFVGN